jgi:hypothetical protein
VSQRSQRIDFGTEKILRKNVMRTLLAGTLMLIALTASAVTFEELGDSMNGSIPPRMEQGVVHQIDFADRTITVGGYEYMVGPATISPAVSVSLYGTSAGSFQLLSAGMKVEIEYIDFGNARVAFRIAQLAPDAEVEH